MVFHVEVFQKNKMTKQDISAKDHLQALGYAFELFDGTYMAAVEFDHEVEDDYTVTLYYILTRAGALTASYAADIPDDCESDPERRFSMAIDMAKEALPEYVMPCDWSLLDDTGSTVTVSRESRYQF